MAVFQLQKSFDSEHMPAAGIHYFLSTLRIFIHILLLSYHLVTSANRYLRQLPFTLTGHSRHLIDGVPVNQRRPIHCTFLLFVNCRFVYASFRQISSTSTLCSDCLIEKTICASVNFDFFMYNFSSLI